MTNWDQSEQEKMKLYMEKHQSGPTHKPEGILQAFSMLLCYANILAQAILIYCYYHTFFYESSAQAT